jgi:hypothetical protein
MSYVSLIKSLKEAVEEGNTPLAQSIKSTVLRNFKGRSVEIEVKQIFGQVKETAPRKPQKIATFTVDDFSPEKKKVIMPTPNIQIVAEDEGSSRIGNMYKAIMEQSDDQLKLKFDKDINVAVDFLNDIRKSLDLELIEEGEFKSFSKKFFDTFRSTISSRIK